MNDPEQFTFRQTFSIAVWFGLVIGLIEGTVLWLLQVFHLQNWNTAQVLTPQIIWIAAVFDLLLFIFVSVLLSGISRFFPGLASPRRTVIAFTFVGFLDFMLLSGRIRQSVSVILAAGLAATVNRWYCKREVRVARLWKRSLPWVVGFAGLALVGIQGGNWFQEQRALAQLPPTGPGLPNVLIIVMDAVRADHLSIYGYSRNTSPYLDRLAQDGALFEEAIAPASWTLPSHASILTGRYPHEHGATLVRLDDRLPILGEAMESRGYRTAAFSANLLYFSQKQGFDRGFIRFEGPFWSIGDMAVRTVYGERFESNLLRHIGFEDVPARKRANDVTRAFLHWAESSSKPFFAFLNLFDAHTPYLPPQPFRSKFSKERNPGGLINWHVGRSSPKLTPEQIQSEMDAYDGAISFMDDAIGKLMESLEKQGIANNLLLVVLSDHGEAFGEHGLIEHRHSLYREEIHVPLIFWWPKHVPAGKRIDRPVSIAALPTTVLDLIGGGGQAIFPMASLSQLWSDPAKHADWAYPLSELAQIPFDPPPNPSRYGATESLVAPQYQYILHQKFGEQLYDWADDPGELRDVSKTAVGKSVLADLSQYIKKQFGQSRVDQRTTSLGF